MCDKVQFDRLFQNLIINAIKYSGEKPKIHISAVKKDKKWLVSVEDNGIGIDPKYKDQIFGIFVRLHGGGKYTGTGIGLAVCKKIIKRHGGEIWVESKVDKGSTFKFTIPIKK